MAVQVKLKDGKKVYEARLYVKGTSTPKKLGRYSVKRQAERLEELARRVIQDNALGALSLDTIKALDGLDDTVYGRMQCLSPLVRPRVCCGRVSELAERLVTNLERAASTREILKCAFEALSRALQECMGNSDPPVRELDTEILTKVANSFLGKYSQATAGQYFAKVVMLLREGVRLGWISQLPQLNMSVSVGVNTANFRYITAETAYRIMNAITQPELKLVFCLSRFAGLRVPSELHTMTWENIHFDEGYLIINDIKKTKGRQNREKGLYTTRVCPLFPEVRDAFEQYKETVPNPTGPIRWKYSRAGWKYLLQSLLRKENIDNWPKLFHNLRASRETELIDIYHFPPQTVCSWIGNSPTIYMKHYARTLDTDLIKASQTRAMQSTEDGTEEVLKRVLDMPEQTYSTLDTSSAKVLLLKKLRDDLASFVQQWKML